MKNAMLSIIPLVVLILSMGICGYSETHYTREGVIVSVDAEEVTVKDTTDNVWSFEGDDFSEGEKVSLKMYTNHTDNLIYDDEIIDVKVVK